jgi:hypothetical protein
MIPNKISLFNEIYLEDYIEKKRPEFYKLPKYSEEELMKLSLELEARKLVAARKIGLISIPDYSIEEKRTISRKTKGLYSEELFKVFSVKHTTSDLTLFCIRPQSYIKMVTEAEVTSEEIIFEIPTGWPNTHYSEGVLQKIKRKKEEIIADLKKKVESLNREIERTNSSLYTHLLHLFKKEKENVIMGKGLVKK